MHHFSDIYAFPFGLTGLSVASEDGYQCAVFIDWKRQNLTVRQYEISPKHEDDLIIGLSDVFDDSQQIFDIPPNWMVAFKKVLWPSARHLRITALSYPYSNLTDPEKKNSI